MRSNLSGRLKLLLAALLCTLLLGACGGGSNSIKPRLFAPQAAIQELRRSGDDQWTLVLRLQNFSNVGMRLSKLDAALEIDGQMAATLQINPDLNVPPDSAEPMPLAVLLSPGAGRAVAAALAAGSSVSYRIHGRIVSTEPKGRDDEFDFESRLTPVPGLADTLR